MPDADNALARALAGIPPGRALDLAAGSGRHSRWLTECGWDVTAVDLPINEIPGISEIPGVHSIRANLENHEYRIAPDSWDLIVCWLYWQPDLLPEIARGVRKGGSVALAGKTSGRFATSLAQFREAFSGWTEIASGQHESRAFFVATKELVD
jgi:SAM-dependent methyltransferase